MSPSHRAGSDTRQQAVRVAGIKMSALFSSSLSSIFRLLAASILFTSGLFTARGESHHYTLFLCAICTF